jgi:DNA primase
MAFERLKDQIKESPLSMVISHYITLNKRGANLEGICPFHADTKPSLKVNDAKGMYKCFACGAGGDHITFVKEYKKLDYVETLKELANLLGLPFEEYQKEKKKNPKVEMAFRVLNASLKIYQKVAEQKPHHYVEFIEKRKLTPETIEKFHIGYAPGNNTLVQYLQKLPGADGKTALQVAQEIGIVRHNPDRNSTYDFYRDRVMFPVWDHSGQIRGYSSRAVLPDQVPKYLNSGESIAFDKGSILFAFNYAKNSIRQLDQVIIVEGHMDAIMMHQFGFNQTVAAMGTAVSEQMVKLLSNITKNVYLAMDNDAAGKKAAQKINAEFLSLGVLPKVISFDPAKDPDEFLLKEGRLALQERLEKAPILLDQLIAELIPVPIPENLELKLNTLQRIFEAVSPLRENLSATERVVTAAKTLRFNADSATILEQYKTHLSSQKEKSYASPVKQSHLAEVEIAREEEQKAQNLHVQDARQESPPLTKSEQLFLREILCHPEFLTHLNEDDSLAYIGHDEVKSLVQWLVRIYREIDDAEYVSIVQEHLQNSGYSKEIRDIGTDALFNHGNRLNDKVVQRMLRDYKARLKLDQLKHKRRALVERSKTEPSQEKIDLILSEISKLDKEIITLKP